MMHDMVKYDLPDAVIATMANQYMGIVVADPSDSENFKAAHNARMVVKDHRVKVEKRRKELKTDALAYGRKVDSEAKRITALLTPIEDHLAAQERIVTDEAARIKREAEEAEAVRLEAIEQAKRDAEQATLDAERARLAAIEAEQKAERDRLAKIEAEQRAAQERIDAENKRIADAEAARLRAIEMEKARTEAAERARIETEKRLAREAEEAKNREIAKAARLEAKRKQAEALRPDVEKIEVFGSMLAKIDTPTVSTPQATEFLNEVGIAIGKLARACTDFSKEPALKK